MTAAEAAAVVDDGYRNTTEFLRGRLRISAAEARRRLALAGELLPRQGFTGEALPPVRGELGAAVAAGKVGSRAATTITLALDRVRHACASEAADRMEYALTHVAAEKRPGLPGPGGPEMGRRARSGRGRAVRGTHLDLFRPGKVEVLPPPRREIVQDPNRPVLCNQGFNEIRTDKPAAAGNQIDHESTLSFSCCDSLLFDLLDGQLEGDDGPYGGIVGHRHGAPVLTDDGAHDGKPQAGA